MLENSHDNVFLVLGVQTREDCISNALAYAFNQSEQFRNFFLLNICDKDAHLYHGCYARTRVSAGAAAIPDIVLVCETKIGADLIIIENKLKAEEGGDQTERYASSDSIQALHNRLCPHASVVNPSFIFLTLFPDQVPLSSKFKIKRHLDLLGALPASDQDLTLASRLIHDWLQLVSRFYTRQEVNLDDRVSEKLQDDEGLDGGYLYFEKAIAMLDLPAHLELEDCWRDSRQGRRYYGVKFSKSAWRPAEMIDMDSSWNLPPNAFSIHFEPQYNVLNGIFNVFLHYEVNPYEPEAWVRKNIPESQYNAYVSQRNKFIEKLQGMGLEGWVFGGGSNQIAKMSLDFQELSFKDAKLLIENLLEKASGAIDHLLLEL